MIDTKNPLYCVGELPYFNQIKAEEIEPFVTDLLQDNREELDKLLGQLKEPTWENLLEPIEALQDRLSQVWGPIGHLNAVCSQEALREAYNRCLPKLSDYGTELGQNEKLYHAVQTLSQSSV